jgi:dTDP-4-amino-4,6-dideoxygalactose transaminase
MYVPAHPGLSPADLVRPRREHQPWFPLDAPHQLRFYRARNAIYHLFATLSSTPSRLTVVAPDYHSGNEVMAIRAAGATIRFANVDRQMRLDPDQVADLCDRYRPGVLFVIHYLGWLQPIQELADLCQSRGIVLVEDCALSLLSHVDGRAIGTFGDFAIYCLYKTVPVPNGAILVANGTPAQPLRPIDLRSAGGPSVAGRLAELMASRLRCRFDGAGALLQTAKRGVGRSMSALNITRAPVGDIGFDLAATDLAMSAVSDWLLERFDVSAIRQRRIANFRQLDEQIDGHATRVQRSLGEGVCPLSYPILVPDKHAAATALRAQGIEAIEMWNDGDHANRCSDARFLRQHVLELPVHQDLTPAQIAHVSRHVARLELRMD